MGSSAFKGGRCLAAECGATGWGGKEEDEGTGRQIRDT